jgi:ABC-type transport system involved in multi-copper enzyme maturation permease subunit
MKYLAILKDSLREAIDTKVFYAMTILSAIVILFVASISYSPAAADIAIPDIVNSQAFRAVYAERGVSLIPVFAFVSYNVNDVKAVTGSNDDAPSSRDHEFELTARENTPFAFHELVSGWMNKANLHGGGRNRDASGISQTRVSDEDMIEFLKNQFKVAGNLEVTAMTKTNEIKPDPKAVPPAGGTYTYTVRTKGASGVRGWQHDISVGFGLARLPRAFSASLGRIVYFIESTLIGGFGAWVAVLAGVVITAFFIPNMLHKGTIDMLLAKPIHRPTLLVYKYIGGLAFVLLCSTIAIGGNWLVLGLRSGIWSTGFLLMILTITFYFAILYSVSTLFAVLTRSPIVSIIVTCIFWFLLWLAGIGYQFLSAAEKDTALKAEFTENGWGGAFVISDIIHAVLPRTADLSVLAAKLVAQCLTAGESKAMRLDLLPDVNWVESVVVSLLFISVMLGLASWRFSRKDF